MEHFDEKYAAFERDVTYFGGELEVTEAEVVAVSQRNEPVVLRHKLGKGTVYLFNSYFHPGRGNLQLLAEKVVRVIVESTAADVTVEDKNELVSWFEYPGKPYNRYFFINTNWAAPQRRCRTRVSVKGVAVNLSLTPAVPVQVAEDGETFLVVSDPALQIVSWRKRSGVCEITLHGGRKGVSVVRSGKSAVKLIYKPESTIAMLDYNGAK
jgi:hypothetical protein